MKKIQKIKGVEKAIAYSQVDEKSLKNTFVVVWKSLADFQKSFAEVQNKLFDLESKQNGAREKRIQFSLSKKGEIYSFSLVFRKKTREQEKADPMVDMMTSLLLGDFTFHFKAPVILETNGRLDQKKGEVSWRFPMLSLAKGTKDIKIKVKFRLKE